MRIRKLASKILGTASYSPPDDTAAPAPWAPHADAHELCELNRSPWDVMSPPPPILLRCHHLRSDPQELEIDAVGGGSLVNDFQCHHKPTSSSPPPRPRIEEEETDDGANVGKEEKRGRKKRRRANKDNGAAAGSGEMAEAAAAAAIAINTRCKKSDGKAWKCKRRAQHPHTLCAYHLNQLRSYNQSYKLTHKVQALRAPVKKRRRAVVDVDAGAGPASFLYYGGFGPWRGKRRGGDRGSATVKQEVEVVVEEEEEEEEKEDGEEEEEESKKNSGSEDDRDAPEMGGCDDGDEGHDVAEDDREGCDGEEKAVSDEGEQTRKKKKKRKKDPPGKRTRKRVKARSLKSLL